MKMINASYGQRNKRIRKERENESLHFFKKQSFLVQF